MRRTHAALPKESFDAVARAEIAAGGEGGRVHHADRGGVTHGHGRAAMTARLCKIRICGRALRAVHVQNDPETNFSALRV